MAADVIGILGFALHAAHKVYDFVETIKDAPEEIRALQKQALFVCSFIPELQNSLNQTNSPSLASSTQLQMLEEEGTELELSVERFLDKVTKKRQDGLREMNKISRVKYWFRTSGGQELRERFKDFLLHLTAVYTSIPSSSTQVILVHSQEFPRTTRIELDTVLERQRSESSYQGAQVQLLQTLVRRAVRSAAQVQSQGGSQSYEQVSSANSLSVQTPHVSFPLPELASLSHLPVEEQSTATPTSALVSSSTNSYLQDCVRRQERFNDARCPIDCPCRCHCSPTVSLVPAFASPFIGRVYLPRRLLSSLWSSTKDCDDQNCNRRRNDLMTIKYYLPTWFAEVDATIRFRAFPLHFCIQTPRIVKSLDFLEEASLDEIKMKLSTREMTINDVEEDGSSIFLMIMIRELVKKDAYDICRYLLECGIPTEWQIEYGLSATEYLMVGGHINLDLRYASTFQQSIQYFQRNIAGPLLHEDLEDLYDNLRRRFHWTELQYRFVRPGLRGSLRDELDFWEPGLFAQLTIWDSCGGVPLDYAILTDPEAVQPLLRAGADPYKEELVTFTDMQNMLRARIVAAMSPLARSGVEINPSDEDGRTILHLAATYDAATRDRGYRFALELVRHAGHTLNWDAQDKWGHTSLEIARRSFRRHPDDEESKLIYELYNTRKAPKESQFVETEGTESNSDTLPSTSLIAAGLRGDLDAIGELIRIGAMVNERDERDHTLLHLAAMGGKLQDGYRVALEVVRHGGYGVHWGARGMDGKTALELAHGRVVRDDLDDEEREEAENVLRLLTDRRLPPGELYVFPCMDPDFKTSSMPGGWGALDQVPVSG